MRRNSWLFSLLALSMLVWSPYEAVADWWKDESGAGLGKKKPVGLRNRLLAPKQD